MAIESTRNREPSIQEMLEDPMVQTLMACDGVTKPELENLIDSLANKLNGGRWANSRANRQEPGGITLSS